MAPAPAISTAPAGLPENGVADVTASLSSSGLGDKPALVQNRVQCPGSSVEGLGLQIGSDGSVSVRVWAPHAASISIEVENQTKTKTPSVTQYVLTQSGHHFDGDLPSGSVKHGDRYRVVIQTHDGRELVRRDPYARRTDFDSEWCYAQDHTKYKWKNTSWEYPEFASYAIYEMHMGSFTPEGTFVAAQKKLQHIAESGFTAVQIMPILEHADLWGYNPRQFLSLHGGFGTPDEFKAFVDEAHGLGLAVVIDVVLHHGAVDGNALWEYDGWSYDNNGGIYHENAPDTEWGRSLAHWKKEVIDMLKDSCAMYIEEYKCDGLRFDSANDLPHDTCRALTWSCRERFPGVIMTAEVTPENPQAVHDLGFDSLWVHSGYFDIIHQHRALGRGHHGGSEFAAGWDFGKLRTVFALHYGFTSPTQCIKYLTGSHDQVGCKNGGALYDDYKMIGGQHRYAVDQFGGGRGDPHARSATRAWFTVNVCAAGIPMMFMGTEWAQPGWWNVDENRRLDWSYLTDEVGSQMHSFISSAMKLRKEYRSLREGYTSILHEDRGNGVIAVDRAMEGEERVIIVLNAGLGLWQSGEYGVHVGGDNYAVKEVFSSQSEEVGGWEGQHTNVGNILPVYDGRIYINLPMQSAVVFTCVPV